MSEYQYYEFRALDRSLTAAQRDELRACSSRAAITATGFRNEYRWGDLKADPRDWMARYFDVHVYSSNWGCCHVMVSMPMATLGRDTLTPFTAGYADSSGSGVHAFGATMAGGRLILEWSLDLGGGDDARFNHGDGPSWLARLTPLREELLRGDLRPLYLGWLSRVCAGELDDDDLEPPAPVGLNALTRAQRALADFLMLDPDLLKMATADRDGASQRCTVAQIKAGRGR